MTIQTNDKIFGLLTQYQNCDWEFEFYSDALSENLIISIEAGDTGLNEKPSENVYTSFIWFRDNQDFFRQVLEKTIFNIYQERFEAFRDGLGDDADNSASMITDSSNIWHLISKPKLLFLSDFADISISFETTWDPEHGITVLIENGKVVLVE